MMGMVGVEVMGMVDGNIRIPYERSHLSIHMQKLKKKKKRK